MSSLRPILLIAVVSLWSSVRVVADDDTPGMTLPPPATFTPFPFCPPLPPGGSIVPFPWTPPSPRTVYPQDPGYFPSAACRVRTAVAWLPMAFALSAFLLFLQ